MEKETGARILIIDDEVRILHLLEQILVVEGYRVTKALSGEAAMAHFREQAFELVITDMRMPGMSGQEVLQTIKALDPTVEVIILTAFGELESAIAALRDDGAYDYLCSGTEAGG